MMLHLQGVIWHNGRQRQLRAVQLPTIVLPNEHPEARKMSSRPPVQIHHDAAPLQWSNYMPQRCGLGILELGAAMTV
jgi:hypothetical protein